MTKVLIDSSVWIEYFKNNQKADKLDTLIDYNLICINNLILAELIPLLQIKKQKELIHLLKSIERIPLNINWDKIIYYQINNLEKNILKIGIPDLIILQNVLDNDLELFTFDKHFKQMQNLYRIKLFNFEN